MSFRLKTILGVAAIEILLLIFLVWSSLNVLQKSHDEELEREAEVVATLLVNASRDALVSQNLENLDKVGNDLLKSPAITSIKIKNAQGALLFDHQSTRYDDSAIKRLKMITLEGMKFGSVEIALSKEFVDSATENARQKMIAIAGVEVLLVALFSYILGTYLTLQLQQLRMAARRIADGELGTQVSITSNDEIGETARSFNNMSNRLNDLYGEIENNAKRMRTVLNTVNDGIMTIDSHGILLSVNPAVSDFFGFERHEMLGRNVKMLMSEPDRKLYDSHIKRHLNKGIKKIIGSRRRVLGLKKNGDTIPLELSVNPMDLDDETLFVGTLRNLSEEENARNNALKAEERLAEAIESSADGFVLYDENDRLVICNQRHREIYASSADLLVPGNSFEYIIRTGVERGQFPQAEGQEEAWIAQRMDDHLNPKGPVELKIDDGRWIRIWENKTDTGAIVGFRIDITELKEREEALLESQDRFRATIETALDSIICVNGEGSVIEFNPAAEKTFGYSRAEAMGQELAQLIIPENMREMHRNGMTHYLKTKEGPVLGKRIEVEALRKNGEKFPIELAIEVAHKGDDEAIFVAYLRDITEQKAYQNNLKEAKQKAEVANEAKASFLAMMSHEIRTPLNGVLGVMGLVSETDLDETQQKYIQTAKDSGEALLTIINDVLDFSKMEAGKLQFEESDIELLPLINSVKELLAPEARAKNLDFELKIEQNVPWSVKCDGGRLRQILLNLTSNGVKFTEQGSVEIRLTSKLNSATSHCLHFEIKDTGVGIPGDLQGSLFGEFSSLDTTYTRKLGGTGLGLAISKKIIELMGGKIGFNSLENKGSIFWFELNVEEGDIPAGVSFEEGEEETISTKLLRILIAEDHPTNMMITRKILERQGHHVIGVGDGIEAIQAVQDFPLDLILMDGSMPEMDGLEATRRIRKMKTPLKDIPIIALTAHAMKGDRERFLEAGMNDYLQKPIRKESVLKTIHKWSNQEAIFEVDMKTSSKPSDKLLDESYLVKLGEDTDPNMVPKLINIFINDAKARIQRIKQAIQNKDMSTIELETHTLGTSAASYGLIPFHKLARRAEAICLEGNETETFKLSQETINIAEQSFEALAAYQKI